MSELRIDLVAIGPDGERVGGDEPLDVTLGQGELPDKLEAALEGASPGDVLEVSFDPGEVFGAYSPENILAVPRDQFDDEIELVKGAEVAVTVESDDGDVDELDARVVEVNDEAVVLDVNPPLAGKAVTLRAEVLGPPADQ